MDQGRAMSVDTRDDPLRTAWMAVLQPVAVAAGIHVVMIAIGYRFPWPLRLLATIAYFTAVLLALWRAHHRLPAALDASFEERYRRAHPLLKDSARRVNVTARALATTLPMLVGAFVATTGASVLLTWPVFRPLAWLNPLVQIAWWCTFGGFAWACFWALTKSQVLLGRRNMLDEERAVTQALTVVQPTPGAATVEVLGDHRFRAGGVDWSWVDLRENMIVFGKPGAGKTAFVLNALLEGLIASSAGSALPPAILLVDGKGDFGENDADPLRALCRKYGREQDLVIIDPLDPDCPNRWNPLDTDPDDTPFEIATRIAAVMEMLGSSGGGGEDAFWIESTKTFVEHAIALLRATNDPGEPPSFPQIMRLASAPDDLRRRALLLSVGDAETIHNAIEYFTHTWSELEPKTRTTIQAFLRNMLGPFLQHPVAETLSGPSTIRVAEALDQGRFLYLRMTTAGQERMARILSTLLKLDFQREVRRRVGKQRYSLFFCDEFQQFVTAGKDASDPGFFAVSRGSNHVNVIATQNLNTLGERLPKRELVSSLLGTCSVKIFLRNTDEDTNRYASDLFGTIAMRIGSEQGQSEGLISELLGGKSNVGGQITSVQKVPPEIFTEIDTPVPGQGGPPAESIIHIASRNDVRDVQLRTSWPLHRLPTGTA